MTTFLSALRKAASFTARGAAVTFGSTVFSCVMACEIEKGANRMILNYYPRKFANVDAASGISQEELDFVKELYGDSIVVAANPEMVNSSSRRSPSKRTKNMEAVFGYDVYGGSSGRNYQRCQTTTIDMTESNPTMHQNEGKLTVNRFWTEGEEAATKVLSIIPIIVPRQEILACSITA